MQRAKSPVEVLTRPTLKHPGLSSNYKIPKWREKKNHFDIYVPTSDSTTSSLKTCIKKRRRHTKKNIRSKSTSREMNELQEENGVVIKINSTEEELVIVLKKLNNHFLKQFRLAFFKSSFISQSLSSSIRLVCVTTGLSSRVVGCRCPV